MPITPILLGSGTAGGGGSTAVISSIAENLDVGDRVIWFAFRGPIGTASGADQGGVNSYPQEEQLLGSNAALLWGQGLVTDALAAGSSFTVTWTDSPFSGRLVIAWKVPASTPIEYIARSDLYDTGFSGAFDTAAHDTDDGENVLFGLAVAANGGKTFTSGGAWTELGEVDLDTIASLCVQYRNTSDGGNYSTDIIPSGASSGVAVLLEFAAATPPLLVRQRLSGGAANADPALAIGGAMSSEGVTLAPGQTGLFGNVDTGSETVDYRGIYIVNNEDTQAVNATVYVSSQFAEQSLELALGAAVEDVNVEIETLADAFTAPGGVSFSAPTTAETGVDLGVIGAGESLGFWLRRTVPATATEDATNPAQYAIYVEPAA